MQRLYLNILKHCQRLVSKRSTTFARLLTKYKIHYDDFEQSFKKNHTDLFSRIFTLSDIKYNHTWCFAIKLFHVIDSNRFLRERITLESSAFIPA